MSQITTCTFFKIDTFSNKWWAFKQMQLGHKNMKNVKGLSFYKILGSGAKNGFSLFPNFGTYVLVCIWDDENFSKEFFSKNAFYQTYISKSAEQLTIFAKAAMFHGLWDKKQPFKKEAELSLEKPVLVLTRARIRFWKLFSFWKRVGSVSHSLSNYNGLKLAVGVGEWPLIQQATISLWQTQKEMTNYAYQNEKHKKVVKLTRELNWYSEELFARFVPYKFDGTWNGKSIQL